MKKICSAILAITLVLLLAVSAFAETNTVKASVTAKSAPTLVTKDAPAGTTPSKYVATILDNKGNVLNYVPSADVTITPYSEAKTGSTLAKAFDEISGTENLGTLARALNDSAKAIDNTYNASGFVCTDLFDVTVSNDYMTKLKAANGGQIRITFKYSGEVPTVMHRNDSTNKWIVVDASDVTLSGNELTVDFDSLCPVAFLVFNPSQNNPTSDNNVVMWGVIGGIVAIAGVAVVLVSRNGKKKETID